MVSKAMIAMSASETGLSSAGIGSSIAVNVAGTYSVFKGSGLTVEMGGVFSASTGVKNA